MMPTIIASADLDLLNRYSAISLGASLSGKNACERSKVGSVSILCRGASISRVLEF